MIVYMWNGKTIDVSWDGEPPTDEMGFAIVKALNQAGECGINAIVEREVEHNLKDIDPDKE